MPLRQKTDYDVQVEHLAEDIKRAALVVGVDPATLKRNEYRQAAPRFYDKHFEQHGGFSRVRGTFFPKVVNAASIARIKDLRGIQAQTLREVGSADVFMEALKEILKDLPPIKIKPYKSKKSKAKIKRYINALISDIHIGSDLKIEETGHEYGIVEEARAMALITKTIIEYKMQYRSETGLNVFLNGDMIENILHGASSADLSQRQVWRCIWLLTYMIGRFAENFSEVNVFCTTGNHDRDTAVNPKRAVSQKFNSLATTIYYATKLATRNYKHVKWAIPMTPWVDVVVLGHRMRSTHGDTALNIGNPGSNLKINLIEGKINKINASLKDANEIKVFLLGHTHTPVVTQLSNGSWVLVNGSSQPPNAFVNSLDILETSNVQLMFETTPEHEVGDIRFIQLNKSFKDASLDKIIPPWPGLNSDN